MSSIPIRCRCSSEPREPGQASAAGRSTEAVARASRLLVVTAHPDLYTPRRLLEAGARLGIPVELRRPALAGSGRACGEVPGHPALLVRPGAFSFLQVLHEQHRLCRAGARPLQPRRALLDACDQWRTLKRATRAGLPVPRTALIRRPDELALALERIAGPPWFVKGRRGSQGTQVLLAESASDAARAVHLFWGTGTACLVQEDLRGRGPIERHLVAAGTVLASALALPAPGEFRSNVHRGGRLVAIEAGSTAAAELAARAVAAIGLPYAGVDAIGGATPILLEVNASPGLEGIERATGRDLAQPLLHALLRYAAEA